MQAHPELDFIICSLHVVDGMDPYYPEYFDGKEDLSAYRHYFETLLACVKEFDNFNVCGHLDYIVRYGKTKADLLISAIMQISLKSCFRFLSPVVRVSRSTPEAYTVVSLSRILIQIS